MFFELSTMWVRDQVPNPDEEVQSGPQRVTQKWSPRRIAVLFSRPQRNEEQTIPENEAENKPWTFLVLVEPSKDDLKFSYREVDEKSEKKNAQCTSGKCYYTVRQVNLHRFIEYVIEEIRKSLRFHQKCHRISKLVTYFGKEVFWSWEEFVTAVMQLTSV